MEYTILDTKQPITTTRELFGVESLLRDNFDRVIRKGTILVTRNKCAFQVGEDTTLDQNVEILVAPGSLYSYHSKEPIGTYRSLSFHENIVRFPTIKELSEYEKSATI